MGVVARLAIDWGDDIKAALPQVESRVNKIQPIRTVLLIELEPTCRPRRLRRLQSIYKRCLKEGLRVFILNRLELFRAKTEQLQNSRGDLRRLYRRRRRESYCLGLIPSNKNRYSASVR
jgi:hypothetical protein